MLRGAARRREPRPLEDRPWAEEYDPRAERLVGNFPQAFSHIGLVNSAMVLSREERAPIEGRSQESGPPSRAAV